MRRLCTWNFDAEACVVGWALSGRAVPGDFAEVKSEHFWDPALRMAFLIALTMVELHAEQGPRPSRALFSDIIADLMDLGRCTGHMPVLASSHKAVFLRVPAPATCPTREIDLVATLGREWVSGEAAPLTSLDRWRLEWPERCDRAAFARLRQLSASGELERDMAALDARRERAETVRLQEQFKRITAERARLGLGSAGSGTGVVDRASKYLAAIPGGCSGSGRSVGAWRVALVLVRGWALDESAALDLMEREYAPRCRPRWRRGELAGMIRRAARAANTGYGWLLDSKKER